MEKENDQMHGQASRDSFYKMRGHLMDIHGPGVIDEEASDFQERLPVARDMEKTCQKERNEKKNKSGLSKYRSLTMPEDHVVFSLLSLMMKYSSV